MEQSSNWNELILITTISNRLFLDREKCFFLAQRIDLSLLRRLATDVSPNEDLNKQDHSVNLTLR